LLPAGLEPATSVMPKRDGALTEVTDIFTTAAPRRIAALRRSDLKSTLGNRRHRSQQSKRRFGLSASPQPATHPSRRTDSTVRSIEGGSFTAHGAKYPKSSPPAFVSRAKAANQMNKQILSRRSQRRAAIANLWVRSAIGIRLAPRSLRQAPRSWARACSREPRDPGLPFRLAPEKCE
jgi:hypothetical protein